MEKKDNFLETVFNFNKRTIKICPLDSQILRRREYQKINKRFGSLLKRQFWIWFI